MNILITAGGTSEPIDRVRNITNMSTGTLGNTIAAQFDKVPEVEKIYYICGNITKLPQSDKTEIIHISDTVSLKKAIESVFEKATVDIIVHSMAVSDYRVKLVTSCSKVADSIYKCKQYNSFDSLNEENAESFTSDIFENSKIMLNNRGKISSDINNMILVMERTPKIISLFHEYSPKSILVGFKLLDSVSREALINAALNVMEKNKCSLVLANDLSNIDDKHHTGYLVTKSGHYEMYNTKLEIASAIVKETIKLKGNRK